MADKKHVRAYRSDPETDAIADALGQLAGGNHSFLIRALIRRAGREAGLGTTDAAVKLGERAARMVGDRGAFVVTVYDEPAGFRLAVTVEGADETCEIDGVKPTMRAHAAPIADAAVGDDGAISIPVPTHIRVGIRDAYTRRSFDGGEIELRDGASARIPLDELADRLDGAQKSDRSSDERAMDLRLALATVGALTDAGVIESDPEATEE